MPRPKDDDDPKPFETEAENRRGGRRRIGAPGRSGVAKRKATRKMAKKNAKKSSKKR